MRFHTLSICLLFLTATLSAQNQKYKSEEGKMSITFPAAFESDVADTGDAKIMKISATNGEQTFFASYTLHTVALTDRELLAETSLESFTETTGGTMAYKKSWNMNGEKGFIALIELEEQKAYLQYQVILIGNIQYQIVVVAPKASWNQKSADKFLKSFKVQK